MPGGPFFRSLTRLHLRDLARPRSERGLRAEFDGALAIALRLPSSSSSF